VLENNLFLYSGSFLRIDTAGGLCGHRNITVNANAKILKYGILELDSLKIPGGQVLCQATGEVVLTLYAIISNGGSLSVSGCSFSLGPWFNCVLPAYHFAIGIEEEMMNPDIKIFPNPNSGIFEISEVDITKKSQLIITDLLGKIIYDEYLNPDHDKIRVDLSFLKNGFYTWIIISENKNCARGKIEILKF
jgi:hypothetical protein